MTTGRRVVDRIDTLADWPTTPDARYLLATGATTGATALRQQFTNGVKIDTVQPIANGVTSLQFQAIGGTVGANFDTTNNRWGFGGNVAPAQAVDVTGSVKVSTALIGPVWAPDADGTAALKITKSNRSTALMTFDTTNNRLGVGTSPSANTLINANVDYTFASNAQGVAFSLTQSVTANTATITSAQLGIDQQMTLAGNQNFTGFNRAFNLRAVHGGTGTVDLLASIYAAVRSNGGGLVSDGYCLYFDAPSVSATPSFTRLHTMYIANQGNAKIGTSTAIEIAAQSGSTVANYAIKTNGAGLVRFGDSVGIGNDPTAALDLLASTTALASLRVRHGAAPTSPNDGDVWTTTAGLFVRINGVTKTVTLT